MDAGGTPVWQRGVGQSLTTLEDPVWGEVKYVRDGYGYMLRDEIMWFISFLAFNWSNYSWRRRTVLAHYWVGAIHPTQNATCVGGSRLCPNTRTEACHSLVSPRLYDPGVGRGSHVGHDHVPVLSPAQSRACARGDYDCPVCVSLVSGARPRRSDE